jgi:threonine/homoserine/homoserine lactone efflux protein
MLITFFIALFLSFIGSLPFGMINMAVANTAIQKGVRAGIFMGLGAALVELFQVYIALKFSWLFEEGGVLGNTIQVIAIVVFFSAGIYFLFFAKTKSKFIENKTLTKRRHEFIKGMGISSLNVMVIPYWIFYGTLLIENDWLEKDNMHVLVFSVGAMTGAFLLLVGYAYLGDKVLSRSEQITKWVNKFIGVVLIGFGVYQLVGWLNS